VNEAGRRAAAAGPRPERIPQFSGPPPISKSLAPHDTVNCPGCSSTTPRTRRADGAPPGLEAERRLLVRLRPLHPLLAALERYESSALAPGSSTESTRALTPPAAEKTATEVGQAADKRAGFQPLPSSKPQHGPRFTFSRLESNI